MAKSKQLVGGAKMLKKIIALILCVGLFGLAIFAQSGKTRPRVVVNDGQPKTTSPSPESSPNPTDSTKRPPVLIGDSKTPTTNDAETVIEDDEIIKVETNLVTIPVTVLDRDGRFVSGLLQNDFQIFEDGTQQKIEYFASVEQPFTVVLLLDVSNSTQFKISEIQNAAITFVNQLRQDDRVMVISFDEKVRVLAPPTNNRSVLTNAIRQINFGGGTSLYEAVSFTINQELRRIDGRKAIVLFTDGVDTTSRRATYQSTVKESEEIDAMIYPIRFDTTGFVNGGNTSGNPAPSRRSGGSVFGQILGAILTGGNVQIGGGGSGTSAGDYQRGLRYLEELANVSGGRKFEAQTTYNLDAAFSGIAEELRRQYSIGYYPENAGQTGQRKQIKVRVDRSNAVVRAKNSYIVGANSTNNTNAKQPTKLDA
ncbi:MAG: VWA domain-containing protein [Blastocatellia bacterium]|nr:VWA domain-containing protein [Blastocatellia bacterium]